ncbi:FecR domain-containing protein [Hydrogenovibrio kuenenii]|uniref:FecR domain-containing protein n=1 Tax=Hydrogenovibrio kuenenii TaxID=63658 RepID=UPI000464C3A2|nr:FecR domain-containing protein [Hydrogenovibrio kuenenii]
MVTRILLIVLLVVSSQAYASIATVAAIKGEANILRADQKLPVHMGDALEEKDQIKTGPNTKVQLIFKDRTIVTIGKNTLFSIPQYVYGDAKTSKVQFHLSKGVFKSMTGKIGAIAKQRFKIKTATATIGIRGTIYIVRVNGDKTQLSTLDGATYMQLNSNGKVYDVPAGKSLKYDAKTGRVSLQNLTIKTVMIQKDPPQSDKEQLEDAIQAQTDDSGGAQAGHDSLLLNVGNVKTDDDNSGDVQLESQTNDSSINSIVLSQTNLPAGTDEQINQTTISIPYQVVAGQDNYNEYGYWADKNSAQLTTPFTNPLSGISQTPAASIDGFSGSAAYTGNLVAISGTEHTTGSILMQVDFGTKAVSGALNDLTINGNKWDNNFTGSLSSSGISVTHFTPKNTPSMSSISGSLNGQLYGNNAQGVAGTFNLSGTKISGGSASVSGSYAAKGDGP